MGPFTPICLPARAPGPVVRDGDGHHLRRRRPVGRRRGLRLPPRQGAPSSRSTALSVGMLHWKTRQSAKRPSQKNTLFAPSNGHKNLSLHISSKRHTSLRGISLHCYETRMTFCPSGCYISILHAMNFEIERISSE